MCSLSREPKVMVGMSQVRQNSRLLRLRGGTEQPAASAAATLSPFGVGGLDPAAVRVTERESGGGGVYSVDICSIFY